MSPMTSIYLIAYFPYIEYRYIYMWFKRSDAMFADADYVVVMSSCHSEPWPDQTLPSGE